MNQKEMELSYAKQFALRELKQEFEDSSLVGAMVAELKEYLLGEHKYSYEVKGETRIRHDLLEVHKCLREIEPAKLFARMCVFMHSKAGEWVDIQQLVGTTISGLEISSLFRKLTAAEILLEVFAECELVEVDTTYGDTCRFKWLLPMDDSEAQDVEKRCYPLPLIERPEVVYKNDHSGYSCLPTGLLLGGRIKGHEENQRYSHINTQNGIQYEYEHRLRELTEPVFSTKHKVKKNGEWETDADVIERYKSFRDIHDSLPDCLWKLQGKPYYLAHGYDSRGRYYPRAYQFNYQGGKFLRAMSQFVNKEIVHDEF